MVRFSSTVLRRRIIPVAAVVAVCLGLVISFNAFLANTSQAESFSFEVYWPRPTQYLPNNPIPSAYLQINYTGLGVQFFNYIISNSTGVVTRGEIGVTHRSPFTIYLITSGPSTLTATVTRDGQLLFQKSLTIG